MDADGNFQPLLVISSYYGIVLILIFYNIVFNTSEILIRILYWLVFSSPTKLQNSEQSSGIPLNSLSSIISYNSYDYSSLLGQKNKKNGHGHANHQQSLIRQCIYTGFVTALYARDVINTPKQNFGFLLLYFKIIIKNSSLLIHKVNFKIDDDFQYDNIRFVYDEWKDLSNTCY